MKQIINKIPFILLFLMAVPGRAQSLKELINLALEKNYQIRITKNETRIAENNNSAGAAGRLPSVDVNGDASGSSNTTRQAFADGSTRQGNNAQSTNISAAALASWTLFDGFRVNAKRSQLKLLEAIGEENSKFYIEQTISDLVLAYYQLLFEQQLLENYRESMEISAFRLELEKKRKSVGSGQGIAFRQALVDYRSDSIRVAGQENAVEVVRYELNRIIGNGLEQDIQITETDLNLSPMPSKDSLLRALEEKNNNLAMQRLQELVSETALRMERADRYPKLSLYAGYQYSATTAQVGFFKSNTNYGPTIGVRVSFNLYNGGNTNREVRNALIMSENAELNREQTDNDLRAELFKLQSRHLAVNEQYAAAVRNVEDMEGVYNIAAEQLRVGAINGYDFRIMQLTLLQTRLTSLQLHFVLKSLEINLHRLTGSTVASYL